MGKKNAVEEIIEEAREDYDLLDRLRGISKRERIVTVYTDEVTGDELGGIEKVYFQNSKIVDSERRWGVRGELADLRDKAKALQEQDSPADEEVAEIKRQFDALTRKAKSLEKKLESTAYVFTLRAVPELIIKRSRRDAWKNIGVKPKGGITEEQAEDQRDEFLAIILSAATAQYVDNAGGKTHSGLSLDGARGLKQFLLPEEWGKLEDALDELQARKAIGDRGTADADF